MIPPPYLTSDPKSFGYPTVHKRWPIIVSDAIKDVEATINANQAEAIKNLGKIIVGKLQKLLQDFKDDAQVRPFTEQEIELNGDLKVYNEQLNAFPPSITWQDGLWLFLECYLYQYMNNFFLIESVEVPFWKTFDVFANLKWLSFKSSEPGVMELAHHYHSLSSQLNLSGATGATTDAKKAIFSEFVEIALWGNATDLSLLAGTTSLEDIQSVQGKNARTANQSKILINDTEKAWNRLLSTADAGDGAVSESTGVHIVLDNAGFELYTDLVFSLILLDLGITNKVTLHAKKLPWFVSDVLIADLSHLLSQIVDPSFFCLNESVQYVHKIVSGYLANGKLSITTSSYWTRPDAFWSIPSCAEASLKSQLEAAQLVIFKGDLNYRKLTGDVSWDPTTLFATALQQLGETKIPILALRTCKADVVVGLQPGTFERVAKEYKAMGDGLWVSSGKWAVISYHKGM
ncbi:uncharacterized protein KQ657_003801 [Scheffersomyces spartinae]|uniref:Sugar phosphate phosphatase n=1 Tax=Scheffersomyces spartinae TaxID=45513 RepID=A0A9P7VCH6_9ASCO|nr:uncharacterized protein KQ657_003801 [Scheffersomyces spartinae]KAG7195275.1 hypothetical protein KQ657_003801 [Scheffersomyces spartinae]